MSAILVDVDTTHVTRPPALRSAPATRPSVGTRLTRRGRLVVLVAVLLMTFGALTLLSNPAASTDQTRHPPAHVVVVAPGQTLWDIASTVAPGEDPRSVVAQIVALNSLTDAGAIRVGQPLYVPAP